VDSRGGDGAGCFRIKVRTDTVQFMGCTEQGQVVNHNRLARCVDYQYGLRKFWSL